MTAEKSRFQWQLPGEKIVIFERKHWMILVRMLVQPLIAGAITVILWVAVFGIPYELDWLFQILFYILLIPSVVVVLWLIWRAIDWYNDYYIVTDRRVLHIEQVMLIWQTQETAQLPRITEVRIEIPHPLAASLGYGNVFISTAGFAREIKFLGIRAPKKVQAKIWELVARIQERAREERQANIAFAEQLGLPIEELQAVIPPLPVTEKPKKAMPKRTTQEGLLRHIYPANPEQVETTITWRKHPAVLIWQIGPPLLILVIGYIALVVVVVMVPDVVLGALLGILVLALICTPWIAWQWVDWMNDLYTVTEDRLIDIERLPFGLWEKRIETTLDKIQDIHTKIPNIVARALNFGDVIIETAGRAEPFTFNYVPHPIDVQNEIFRRLDEFRSKQQSRSVAEQQHSALSIVRKCYESPFSHPAEKTEEE